VGEVNSVSGYFATRYAVFLLDPSDKSAMRYDNDNDNDNNDNEIHSKNLHLYSHFIYILPCICLFFSSFDCCLLIFSVSECVCII